MYPNLNLIPENECYIVTEISPTDWNNRSQLYLNYIVTLIVYDSESVAPGLILTCPERYSVLPVEPYPIQRIIQISFNETMNCWWKKRMFETIEEMLKLKSQKIFSEDAGRELKGKVIRLAEEKGFDSEMLFFFILHELSLSPEKTKLPEPESERLSRLSPEIPDHNKRLSIVVEYVKKNYHKTIRLKEVAAQVHLSEQAFCSYFKKQGGMNFINYVNKIRIDHAKYLLRNTDDTVEGVAFSCGFNTLSHFKRIFKEETGMNPGEFRRKRFNGLLNERIE